jgi:ribosomal protein S18 acetylase RimI-like enzyme
MKISFIKKLYENFSTKEDLNKMIQDWKELSNAKKYVIGKNIIKRAEEINYIIKQKDFIDFFKLYDNIELKKQKDILIDDYVDFYNSNFPNSQHSKTFKEDLLNNGIVLTIVKDKKIIALIEGKQNIDHNLLITLVVDKNYQNRGYAKKLFNDYKNKINNYPIVLHFRESKEKELTNFYQNLGFKDKKVVGNYRNGEKKFEMKFYYKI